MAATGIWTHGKVCPLTFTLLGSTDVATIQKITSEDGEEVDVEDITHSGSGGFQALLAGIFRGTFTLTAFSDTTTTVAAGSVIPPGKFYSTVVGIRAGNSGTIKHYITAALFQIIPVLIVRVTRRVPVNAGVQYTFDARLNSEAGTYTYAT